MKTTKTEANYIKGYLDKALLDVSHISTYVELLNEKIENIKTYYYKDKERIGIEENIKVRDTIDTLVDGVDIYAQDIEKVLNELYTKINDKK